MALPNTKVEIAFNAGYTTAAASRVWTDVSAYVEGAYPLTIGRGRGDEVSQVQPSRLALVLDNRDGRFTPRLASGAYYPNVKKGRPVRVTVTYNAVNYTRYIGYVSEWPVSWPDGTSAACVVSLTSASRMARMGRGAELRSVVEEEILADDPSAYYTLGEPAGSTSATDSSGNQAPALTMVGDGAVVVFGNATGPGTDGLTAAEFAGGKWLAGTTPAAPLGFGVAFLRAAAPASSETILNFNGDELVMNTSGQIALGTAGITSATSFADGETHWAEVRYSGGSAFLYVDDAAIGSAVSAAPLAGAFSVGGGTNLAAFTGTLAMVVIYAVAPSALRVADHAEAILTGFAGELSGARIERYASYGLIPAAEVTADTGEATIGHFDITGMTPITAMQKVVETENGVLFDAKDGTLTFKQRSARYNAASSFSLDVTAQEVEADLESKDDDQFLINDVTATANGDPAGRAVDSTSRDEHGVYAKNLDTVTDDEADALAGAQWAVAQGKDPEPRYTQVTVDITNSSTAQANAVLAAEIGTRFTLTNLPSQVNPTADLFVEGYSESITATAHTITFNTSPATGYDVWTIEDAVFGQYDAYPIAY